MSSRYLQLRKGTLITREVPKKEEIGKNKSSIISLVQFTNIGFTILSPIVFGLLVGIFIDNTFETGKIAIVVGIIAGALFSFFYLYTIAREKEQK
jgi:F0F1-type ATP synthase assembly protein I